MRDEKGEGERKGAAAVCGFVQLSTVYVCVDQNVIRILGMWEYGTAWDSGRRRGYVR